MILVQFIQKLAVIHDSADRRIGLRSDFNQIELPLASER
jgi:hypothetical protein